MIKFETVPCKICTKPTVMTGTKLCNGCWEVDHRLIPFLRSAGAGGRALVIEALIATGANVVSCRKCMGYCEQCGADRT